MSEIYLVRHADKERIEQHDSILRQKALITTKGVLQSQAVARYLSHKDVQIIASSPILRCQQTASYIATELKKEVILDDGLRERLLFTREVTTPEAKFIFESAQKDLPGKQKKFMDC